MKPLSCRCLAKVNPNPESQPVISTALLPICKTKQNKKHWNWVFEISDLQYTEQITSLSRSSLFQGCSLHSLPATATQCLLNTGNDGFILSLSSEAGSLSSQHRGVQHLWKQASKQTDQANHHALAVHIHLEIWKYTRQFPRHVFPSSGTDPICSKQAGVHSSVHAAHRPWRRQFDWRKDMV